MSIQCLQLQTYVWSFSAYSSKRTYGHLMPTAADVLWSFSGHSCRRTYHREPCALPVLIQRGSGHTLVVPGVKKVHRDDVETAVTAGPSGHLEKRQHRLVIVITPKVPGHL